MPFRARFDCLWCGTAWDTRSPADLEGWAQLCPACLGKAGTNPFLRARLRTALEERGAATAERTAPVASPAARPGRGAGTPRGRVPDDRPAARRVRTRGHPRRRWQAELMVTLWLDVSRWLTH
jgi:hypothetical protein